jgi:hypothetical protein
MPVNRVQVVWSGPSVVGGGLSTFYFFDNVGTPAQHVAAAALFLSSSEALRISGTVWTTVADVATLNTATGALEGITSTTTSTGTGTASGDATPPTTQGLLRLYSNTVVGGRLLRGRLFLPGVPETLSTGAPTAAFLTGYNASAANLVASANADWAVWSKTHGVLSSVQTANTWNKFAVLRSRRD